jgi:hypothetical protein
MPAAKPNSLSRRNTSKADSAARTEAESAITPVTRLTVKPPKELSGLRTAAALWTEVITLQEQTQAAQDGSPIITSFDRKILIAYCKLEEECLRWEAKRDETEKKAKDIWAQISKLRPKGEEMKNYVALLTQYNALDARVQGWDGRLDIKRGLLHKIAQSLYLTPRSRAGVNPPEKEKPSTDPMENVL